MAKNPPAFQLYASDLLGGVMAMSDEACGVYVKLLCALWIQGGTLPYDHHRLAVCALTTPECFERVWPEIENKFVVSMRNDNGRNASVISNQRLDKTRENQYVKATAGRRGGFAKQAKRLAKPLAELEQSAPMKTEVQRVKTEDRRSEDRRSEDGKSEGDDLDLTNSWDCAQPNSAHSKSVLAKRVAKGVAKPLAKPLAESWQSAPMKNEERSMKFEDRRSEDRRSEDEGSETDDWVLPDGWDCAQLRSALERFEAMRLDIRKPIRSRSRTSGIFSRFAGPEHLLTALDECTANEWQGLKPEYGVKRTGGKQFAMTFEQQKLENGRSAAKEFITDDRIR